MRTMTMVVLALLISGCVGPTHKLDEQYRPLEEIKQTILRPGTGITTVGKRCYVNDLDEWLAKRPPGSARFHAIMIHERLHAQRQLDMGLTKWLGRYLNDSEFMWDEEARGWYLQLQEYRRRGVRIIPENIAKILAGYKNFSGAMIDYEDALTWVRDVLAGRWRPSE